MSNRMLKWRKKECDMFCPNCGKQIKDFDNFCRFCGADLRNNEITSQNQPVKHVKTDTDEEYVLYDVKKHWISLVLSVFLIPLFFFYFWNIFLNTHSIFSWIVVLLILGFIFYPVARFKSDRIVVTNKFIHIKYGVLNPEEINIPLEQSSTLEIFQTSMGRIFDYGTVCFTHNGEKFDYGYIQSPEDLQYIIDNPSGFVEENL
jgi:membrane protein YdbS with pleckstrin-like domain